MSQEKVERYKQEKANKKKIMKKKRMQGAFRTVALSVVVIALVGWIGYSAVDSYRKGQDRPVTEIDYESVNDYLEGLSESAD